MSSELAVVTARERIESLRAVSPAAVRLAALVSTAMRVEPELLRRCRLLLADADVTAEADLWASDLLSGATPLALTLRPEVARLLRCELAALPGQLRDSALDLVAAQHGDRHWSVRLEERVNELEVTGGPAAASAQQDLLLAAIGELVSTPSETAAGPQARIDIARWLLSALARLPVHLVGSEAGVAAGAAGSLNLDGRVPPAGTRPVGEQEQWLQWLLAAGALGRDVPIGIRFTPGRLELNATGPDVATIHLPSTEPIAVDLGIRGPLGMTLTRLALSRSGPTVIPVDVDEVSLAAIDGRRWTVRRGGMPHTAGFDFCSVRAALRPCLAREKEVLTLLGSVRSRAWTVISGPPGIGASTVLNAVLDELDAMPEVSIAAHFLGVDAAWDEPDAIVASLHAQLQLALPQMADVRPGDRVDPADRLNDLLVRAGEVATRSAGTVVVAFDGLGSELPAGLRDALSHLPTPFQPPAGVHFLISTQFDRLPDWLGGGRFANRLDLGELPTRPVCQAMMDHAAPLVAHALRPPPPGGGRSRRFNDRPA